MTSTAPTRSYDSLAEQAYHVLRDRLVMLDIAPGAPVNEAQLATELGIGRTPIRESLKKLEVDHLVASFPRRGTFATQVDITDLGDIGEMRHALEPLAARRAARLARPGVREELRAKAEQIAEMTAVPGDGVGEARALMEYDLAVHRLIYRAAENPHLEETLVRLDNLVARIWCLVVDRMPALSEHIREHVSLLEAILDRDADRAERLAAEHVTHFEESLRQVL